MAGEAQAALRAFLAMEAEKAEYLHDQLLLSGRFQDYGKLVYAAFVIAARRQFSPAWTISEVVRYVATVRARFGPHEDDIAPIAAESLIRRALGDEDPDELDDDTKARTQLVLLLELVADQGLNQAGLDDFLAATRDLASQLIR